MEVDKLKVDKVDVDGLKLDSWEVYMVIDKYVVLMDALDLVDDMAEIIKMILVGKVEVDKV